MAKKNYYAVVKGRKPGIYTRWSGVGGAEEQVRGYPGAVYKGFGDRLEAESYMRSGGKISPAAVELFQEKAKSQPLVEKPRVSRTEKAKTRDAYKADLSAGMVIIFTDGASTGNPGPGGYGVVMLYGDARKELSAGFRCTTNNRMELLACIAALRELKRQSSVIIYSDSRYVVDAVEKGWARRWRQNNWMRTSDEQGNAQPAENADLWAQMLDLLDQFPVNFRWVKGHASHPENERCDQLAVQAAHQPNLPPDPGYKRRCRA